MLNYQRVYIKILWFILILAIESKYPNGWMVYNGQSAKNMDDE